MAKNAKKTAMQVVGPKLQAKDVRKIETSLMDREEEFRVLALAEAVRLPVLFIGDPGNGKTRVAIDYAKSWLLDQLKNSSPEEFERLFNEKFFMLETDEGTKSSEVKGMPNMKKLFIDNTWETLAPITDAEVVVINEIDKASSNTRNSLLGIMNERMIFNGEKKIPCKWRLFIATCNEIPKDEEGSPFWSRFAIVIRLDRLSPSQWSAYFARGGRKYRESFTVTVPSATEMDSVQIAANKLDKFINVAYTKLTDRSITYIEILTQAASYVWGYGVDRALIKVCALMVGDNESNDLQSKLISPEMRDLMIKVQALWQASTKASLEQKVAELGSEILNQYAQGKIDDSQVDELQNNVSYILKEHKVQINVDVDDMDWTGAMRNQNQLEEVN